MVGVKSIAAVVAAVGAVLPVFALPVLNNRAPEVVPGKYIVTLKPSITTNDVEKHLAWVSDIHSRSLLKRDTSGVNKVFTINDFHAYSGSFDDVTIKQIEESNQVAAIEPDKVWKLTAMTTEHNATWGLGSISHTKPNFTDYIYDSSAGAGTYAYIIDTGLYTEHVEFEGRAFLGYNAYPNSSFVDQMGHGTHTAGTIASRAYGVAKQAQLISVKVFDEGSSTTEIVLDGYTWAVNNITSTPGRAAISVISMSLGGPQSDVFNAAVKSAFQSNVLSVVAAGNSYEDAKNVSPASAPEAVTVAAVDVTNTKPDWSNFGSLVDIFAPGVGVLSCWIGAADATAVLDGTSMSTPHISGLVLYLKGLGGADIATSAGVTDKIKGLATVGVVQSPGDGTPNLLAYNGNGA